MSTLSQFLNPSIGTTNVGNFRLFDSSGTVTVPSSAVYIAYAALGGGSTAHSLATQTEVTPFPVATWSFNRILASGSGGGFSYNDGSISIPAPITATVTVGASGNSTGSAAGNTSITGIPLGSIAGNGGAPGNTGGGSSSGGIINNSGGNGDGFILATGPSPSPVMPASVNALAYSGGGAGGLYSSGGNGSGLQLNSPTLYNTINNAVGGGGAGGSGGGTGGHLQNRPGAPGLAGLGGRGVSGTSTPATGVIYNQSESGTPGYIIQYNSRGNFSQLKTFFAAAGGGGAGGGSSANNLAIVSAGHGGSGGGGGAFTFGGSPSVYGSAGDGGFMGGGGIGSGVIGSGASGAANNFSGNGGRGGGGGTSYMLLASLTPSPSSPPGYANSSYQAGGSGGKGVAGIEWWIT